MKQIEQEIIHAIRYFSLFDYPPTADEVYRFLKTKAFKRHFTGILEKMIKKKIITRYSILDNRYSGKKALYKYTVGEYSKFLPISNIKYRISLKKIVKIDWYIKLLSLFPQIKLIGLSGTVAMMNAQEKDDIDLFIITAKNRLFSGRFIAVILAQLMGVKRERINQKRSEVRGQKPENSDISDLSDVSGIRLPTSDYSGLSEVKDKACLNLFFDESDMKVPKYKQTEYVGHEVLQMKPVHVKGDVYQQFLKHNSWVFSIFPNAAKDFREFKANLHEFSDSRQLASYLWKSFIGDKIESLLKHFQLFFIRKHQTKELITSTQLWFHPDDFGEKLASPSQTRLHKARPWGNRS